MRHMAKRDPVSAAFDASARRLLERAYAARGQWVQAWLPDPDLRQRTRWLEQGINVDGADPLPPGGGVDAKTRWARGFVRALYFNAKWYRPARGSTRMRTERLTSPSSVPLRVQVGRHVPGNPGGGLPPRRRVRIMIATGGQAKDRAVTRLADRDRRVTPDGKPGARFAQPAYRDWDWAGR